MKVFWPVDLIRNLRRKSHILLKKSNRSNFGTYSRFKDLKNLLQVLKVGFYYFQCTDWFLINVPSVIRFHLDKTRAWIQESFQSFKDGELRTIER